MGAQGDVRRPFFFYVEHWRGWTIASELNLHPDTVKRALETERFKPRPYKPLPTDPFLDFIEQTLKQHPRLRATRLFEMLRDRGYQGNIFQLRRATRKLRPISKEAFLRLSVLPGEHYGKRLVMLRGGGDPTSEGVFSAVVDFLCYITGFKETRANTPALDVAMLGVARPYSCHTRSPVVVSASPSLPCQASLQASRARPARHPQMGPGACATTDPIEVPVCASDVLRLNSRPSPDCSQIFACPPTREGALCSD